MTIVPTRNRPATSGPNCFPIPRRHGEPAFTDSVSIPRAVNTVIADGGAVFGARNPRQLGPSPLGPCGKLPAHAISNIEVWTSYLPSDCVQAMIKNGWHLTV